MDMDRASATTATAVTQRAPTHMESQQDMLNFVEEVLVELKNRLADAGFYICENDKTDTAKAPTNDTRKDVLNNTIQRIKKLVCDLKDQIGQVC